MDSEPARIERISTALVSAPNAHLPSSTCVKRFNGTAPPDSIPPILLYIASGYLLLWVALFNGYPLFYPDSAGYIMNSFDLKQPIYRNIGYSIFIRLVNFGASPWFIVIAQSVIAVFVLHSVFKFMIRGLGPTGRQDYVFLGLVVFLAFGTTLPWFAGQIMPDVFTGLALLSLFLLLYDPDMSLTQSVLTSLVFFISMGAHITHLLTASALLVAVFMLGIVKALRWLRPARATKEVAAFVLMPILAVGLLTAYSNWNVGYGFSLSPGGNVFLFARLMESGLAPKYLQQECKTEELTPCKHLHDPAPNVEQILWSSYPLLKEMGGWDGARAEAGRIVSGTIRHNPLGFLADCTRQMLRQFITFTPGDENYPYLSGPDIDIFLQLYPGEVQRYVISRQSKDKLRDDGKRVSGIDAAAFWFSLGICVIELFSRRPGRKVADQLFILSVAFLFGNALTTGALAGIYPRYQARASWLMAMCCAAYVLPYVMQRRKRNGRETITFETVEEVDV